MGLCESHENKKMQKKKEKKRKQVQQSIPRQKTLRKQFKSTVLRNQKQKEVVSKNVFAEIRKSLQKQFDINLVYKASEGHYLASQFHERTQGIKNTLFLARTTENRIFGAFTSCAWRKDQIYQYEMDDKKKSFLFCLSAQYSQNQNETSGVQAKEEAKVECKIFKLNSKQKAIMNHSECGPIFGEGHDIYIADKCNLNENWCNVGKSYECEYPFGSAKANNVMAGQSKFFVVEYQIWEMAVREES